MSRDGCEESRDSASKEKYTTEEVTCTKPNLNILLEWSYSYVYVR